MTALAESVATYTATWLTGVPLSFVLLAAALLPFTAGYAAASRHVPHAGVTYSNLAVGLGRS
jgi:hypothetical protein